MTPFWRYDTAQIIVHFTLLLVDESHVEHQHCGWPPSLHLKKPLQYLERCMTGQSSIVPSTSPLPILPH
jgi:hypothetical protein